MNLEHKIRQKATEMKIMPDLMFLLWCVPRLWSCYVRCLEDEDSRLLQYTGILSKIKWLHIPQYHNLEIEYTNSTIHLVTWQMTKIQSNQSRIWNIQLSYSTRSHNVQKRTSTATKNYTPHRWNNCETPSRDSCTNDAGTGKKVT